MDDEALDIPLYYLRSYKWLKALTYLPNFNCVMNANGTFLNQFFERLSFEVFAPQSQTPFVNMKHLGRFLYFLFKNNPVNFQAFFLMYNLPFLLYEFIGYSEVFDLLLECISPAASSFTRDYSEETLNRFCQYFKMSRFFADFGELLFTGEQPDDKKKSVNFKPMFIGEISKVVTSGNTGAAFDVQELPKEDVYSIVEERKKIKSDIDLLLKHFNEASKHRGSLYRMRSFSDQIKANRQVGFEAEKARHPAIFEKLSKAKERIIFVDYEKIKHNPLFQPRQSSPKTVHTETILRSTSPTRLNKKGAIESMGDRLDAGKKSLDGTIISLRSRQTTWVRHQRPRPQAISHTRLLPTEESCSAHQTRQLHRRRVRPTRRQISKE